MDCVKAEDLLAEAIDGTLSAEVREELAAHIAGCSRCRALGEALREVREILGNQPVVDAPEGLVGRVAARAVERRALARRARAARRWSGALRLAAALTLCTAGVVLLFTGQPTERLRQGGRLVTRTVNAAIQLGEQTDRLLEDVKILRVLAATALQGRWEQVGERVDDYKRLLEKRRASGQGTTPGARPTPGKKSEILPFSNGITPLLVGVDVIDEGASYEQRSS